MIYSTLEGKTNDLYAHEYNMSMNILIYFKVSLNLNVAI